MVSDQEVVNKELSLRAGGVREEALGLAVAVDGELAKVEVVRREPHEHPALHRAPVNGFGFSV